jgi:phosphatidylethanolamine/phosphatidyl-N-methylethanolamine N-methyltransferase
MGNGVLSATDSRPRHQERNLSNSTSLRTQLFVSQWLRNPRAVGALAPSGQRLAFAMAAQVVAGSGLVVELGAGTGAITAALLRHGVAPEQLVVIENSVSMAHDLVKMFPAVTVLQANAARLSALLQRRGCATASTVVSSLPLLSLPSWQRHRILKEIASVLPVGGRLIQFTYSPLAPISVALAKRLGLEGNRVRRVAINLPPAAVWVYEKKIFC